MKNLIENFQKNPLEVRSFLMKQESASTVELFGPTKSTKSTVITELLEPASNKLIGYNVGEDAQTTLIRLVLMLNSRLHETQVIVKCIPYDNNDTMFLTFLTELKRVFAEELYDNRDELETYQVEENFLKLILNPKTRSYHCFTYVVKSGMLEEFLMIIRNIVSDIINTPELLSDEADSLFKQRRKSEKELRKKEVYEEVIEKRFCNKEQHQESIRVWFNKLRKSLLDELKNSWNHILKNNSGEIEGYVICDNISESDSGIIGQIIKRIYEKDSAYSLVFSEVNYVTAPSEQFTRAYKNFLAKEKDNHQGQKLKINIIDTMGITQVSTEKEQISDEMDKIFQRKTDAYLFLCSTIELPTTYDDCISLLKSKQAKYQNKVFVICRTKADEIIRNKMINNWRKDTGKNVIDDEHYGNYLLEAFEEFKQEMTYSDNHIRSIEYSICNHLPIEFLCTAPDMSKDMRKVLKDGELESSKIYKILYDIMKRIDNNYSGYGNRLWLYSDDLSHRPLNIQCKAQELSKTISTALVTCNMQQHNQYLQYDTPDVTYHWNSVYCFYNKLSWGEGHETRAKVYGSFKLYLKNMVRSWLSKMIPMHDMLNDISISYEHLENDLETVDYVKKNFLEQFRKLISLNWYVILDTVSKKLTYDCLQPELNQIFIENYYDYAFKKSLRYFDKKFSDEGYWKNALLYLLLIEFDGILQKMYIFDEV